MNDEDEGKYSVPTDYGFKVYRTADDMVAISQEVPMDEDAVILISPDRIDRLVSFLKAVKDEIVTDRADKTAAQHIVTRPELA